LIFSVSCFSALQRAEIAEIDQRMLTPRAAVCFSALQRAEIAEINNVFIGENYNRISFSALQRAEIAEIR